MVSKPHTRCLAIAVILAFALPTLATARTWHVPTDAPTIQAGIDSAGVGDDVLVAPGTYFEHDIVMKAGITVHSAQGPDQTTVNATGAGVGFMCVDQEELATLEGFTVLNGLAEGWDQDGNSGGGVKCVDSDIVIRNCDIIDCVAHDMGGGVYAWASNVEIDECKVIGCSAYQFAGIAAFGFDSSRVAISDCEIRGNTSSMGVG